jgi:hypothetical protein
MKLAVVNFHFERPEMTNISLNNNLKYWNEYSDKIDYYCVFVSGETKRFPSENNLLVEKEILEIKKEYPDIKFYKINNKKFSEDTCFNTFKEIVINGNYDGCFVLEDDVLISSSFFEFGLNAINKLSIDKSFFSLNLYGNTIDFNFFNQIKKTDCFVPWGFYITRDAIISADKYINLLISFKEKNVKNEEDLYKLSLDFVKSTDLNKIDRIYLPGILGGDGLLGLVSYNKNMTIYSSTFSRAYNIGVMGEHNIISIEEYNNFVLKYKHGVINKDIHDKEILIDQKNIILNKIEISND